MKFFFFFYHGCHYLFIPLFDHDDDPYIVDLSKPPIFDDLSVDEMETPQVFLCTLAQVDGYVRPLLS